MIDLHTHTSASDGSMSPSELVAHAAELGLTCLAVTDHDTTNGLDEARRACEAYGIGWIPGIEMSTKYLGRSMDLLGYGIDPTYPALLDACARLRRKRVERVEVIVSRLNEQGIEIEMEQVQRLALGGTVGRPHVAMALVEAKAATSVAQAFDDLIGKGKYAYVPKETFSPAEAIGLIIEAGGLAVLAHPAFIRLDPEQFESALDDLIAVGLSGIEVYYGRHTAADVARFSALAREKGLLMTGGSDFHGKSKPDVKLGLGPGEIPLGRELADALLAAIDQRDKKRA